MDAEQPIRVQRKRTKGWKMPPNTVYVGRPTIWGNPWLSLAPYEDALLGQTYHCVQRLEKHLACFDAANFQHKPGPFDKPISINDFRLMILSHLRGKNLACWCPADKPCHADVLLELANRPTPQAVTGAISRTAPDQKV